MTDREAKKQLKNKIDRFLYEQVTWESDATDHVLALQQIIDDLICLKFEGGFDHVTGAVIDAQQNSYLIQKVPFPKEGIDHSKEYRQALSAVSLWLTNLSALMSVSEIDCTEQ